MQSQYQLAADSDDAILMTAPAGEVAGIFAGTIGRGGAARSAPVPAKSRASLASTITGGIVMSSAGRYAGGG